MIDKSKAFCDASCNGDSVHKETIIQNNPFYEELFCFNIFAPLYILKVKRPSHVKLMVANSCCQTPETQIDVCERHNDMLANCWRE